MTSTRDSDRARFERIRALNELDNDDYPVEVKNYLRSLLNVPRTEVAEKIKSFIQKDVDELENLQTKWNTMHLKKYKAHNILADMQTFESISSGMDFAGFLNRPNKTINIPRPFRRGEVNSVAFFDKDELRQIHRQRNTPEEDQKMDRLEANLMSRQTFANLLVDAVDKYGKRLYDLTPMVSDQLNREIFTITQLQIRDVMQDTKKMDKNLTKSIFHKSVKSIGDPELVVTDTEEYYDDDEEFDE